MILSKTMGMFNWVFKGVKVEKRQPKTRSSDAVMDLQPISTDFTAPSQQTSQTVQPDIGSKSFSGNGNAASILFENTERHVNQGFNYDQNSFAGGGQFGIGSGFGAGSALGGATHGNRNILVVTPSSNTEVTEVVANLTNGEACIICLEGLDVTDAQRRLDFLSGVVCAMNGSIKRLNANTYVLTPRGIGVRKQQ